MSGYGFRLYTVKLVTGRQKSKAVEFDKCGWRGDQHVGVWVRRLLEYLETFGALTGPPQQWHAVDEDEPPAISTYVRQSNRGEYRTKFLGHTTSPTTRIRFRLEYGRTGKVSVGVQDGNSLPLSHIPTGDVYRGILYLPETGTKGLLALESVPSAPNPQRMLNAWLARAALDMKVEDESEISNMSAVDAQGADPHPFKLNFNQYPNIERIEKAVANNSAAKVVLRKDMIDGGATQTDEQVILSSTLTSQKKRSEAAKMAGNMVRHITRQAADNDPPVTLEDLETLVDGSLEGIEWTEGYIQIDDETGLKKIGLEKVDKFFVYPVGSATPLSDTKFEQAVAREVVDLQAKLGLQLNLA
jgi:hypothetical protein